MIPLNNNNSINSDASTQNRFKKLTKSDWTDIQHSVKKKEYNKFDVSSTLWSKGYSSDIENITFHNIILSIPMILKDMKLTNCIINAKTIKHLENVTFENCIFSEEILFENITIVNSNFRNCKISSVYFINSILENCNFYNCNFNYTYFIFSMLKSPNFQQCLFLECCFLMSNVNSGELDTCDLTNALLLDTKQQFSITGGIAHHMTKPIIALGWDFNEPLTFAKFNREALMDNGMIVLKYSQAIFPDAISIEQLCQDLEVGIRLKEHSGVQGMLENSSLKEIEKVCQMAKCIVSYSQGIVLPGGSDIPEYFYCSLPSNLIRNVKKEENHYANKRTLLELALVLEAKKRNMPIMGICRGAQLINIFHGGTLKTLKKYDATFQPLEWTPFLEGEKIKASLSATVFYMKSAHHQAVDKLGKGLNVIVKNGQIPKFFLSEDGLIMGSQVHPEFYLHLLGEFSDKLKYTESEKDLKEIALKQPDEREECYQKIFVDIQKQLKLANIAYNEFDFERIKSVIRSIIPNREIYTFFIRQAINYKRNRQARL